MPGSSKKLPAPLQRQYTLLRIYSVIWYGLYSYYLVFQPLYMVNIGIPLSGVFVNGAFSVVLSFFFQNWWSHKADTSNQFKKFIIIGNIFMALACLAIPYTSNLWGVLLTTLLFRSGPNSDALVTTFVYKFSELTELGENKSEIEKKYHRINIYSRYRRFGSIGWAIALPIMGLIVNKTGSWINFYVASIGFIVISIGLFFLLDEKLIFGWKTNVFSKISRKTEEKDSKSKKKYLFAIKDLLMNKSYLFFILAAFLYSVAAQSTYQVRGLFYNIFAQDNYLLIVLVYSFSALIEWPVMSIIAKYINRIGWEKVLIISYLMTAFRLAVMPLLVLCNSNIIWSYTLQIITGVAMGIKLPSSTFGIYSILDDNNRASGQSFYYTIGLVGNFMGSIIGAGLAFFFNSGYSAIISIHWFAALIALVAGVFFFKVKQ